MAEVPIYAEAFRKKHLPFEGMLVPFPALGGNFCIPCIMGHNPSRSCNTQAFSRKPSLCHGSIGCHSNFDAFEGNARGAKECRS